MRGRHRGRPDPVRLPQDRRLPRRGRDSPRSRPSTLFKRPEEGRRGEEPAEDFLEYRVNLLVDNSDQNGAPVVMETNPNYVNLFGSIESTYSRAGMGQTDFTMIKAGSFLKANGGYLVVNALDALVEPGVWATLKRTLRNQIFEIQNYLQMYLFSNARPQAGADQVSTSRWS
ncbi:MAG: AAA family ATPase [Candidatus Moduliflexus flocculans]|nr:AAA family ATPase [Candidatus Moduliflexus flocculans]